MEPPRPRVRVKHQRRISSPEDDDTHPLRPGGLGHPCDARFLDVAPPLSSCDEHPQHHQRLCGVCNRDDFLRRQKCNRDCDRNISVRVDKCNGGGGGHGSASDGQSVIRVSWRWWTDVMTMLMAAISTSSRWLIDTEGKPSSSRRRRTGGGVAPTLIATMLLYLTTAAASVQAIAGDGMQYETAYACEGKILNIECRPTRVIKLVRANYGRFSISICNDHGNTEWSVNCMSAKSMNVLEDRCNGRQNCSVLASTTVFGDLCTNTLKYLEAQYQCITPTDPVSTVRPSLTWLMTPQMPVWRSTVPTSLGPVGSNSGASGGSSVEKSKSPPEVHHLAPPTSRPQITLPPDLKLGTIKSKNDRHSPDSEKTPPKIPPNTLHPIGQTNISNQTHVDKSKISHSNDRPSHTSKTAEHVVTESPKKVEEKIVSIDNKNIKNIQSQIPPYERDREHTVTDSYGNKRHHHHHNHHETPGIGVTGQPLWRHCPPQMARGLQWNWTAVDDVAVQPCPGGATGLAKWRCVSSSHRLSHYQQQRRLGTFNKDSAQSRTVIFDTVGADSLLAAEGHPVWISENPDLSECRSVWLNGLDLRVTDGESILSIINDLSKVTSSQTLYGGDMMTTTSIINRLARKMSDGIQGFPDHQQKEAFVTDLLLGVVKTGSNLLDITQQASWKDLGHPAQMRVVTTLLIGLEDNAFLLAMTIQRQKVVLHSTKNILLSVRVLETKTVETEEFPSVAEGERGAWTASQDVIYLPRGALMDNSEGGLVRIVFVAFDRLEEILQPLPSPNVPSTTASPTEETFNQDVQLAVKNSQLNSERDAENITRIVNSKIISASLGKGRHIQLSQPVRMTLHHLQTENVTNPTCVFWDYTENVWSPEGCRVEWTNRTHTGCQCTHLTIFAILMDVHSVPLSPTNAIALNIITLVGCSISVIALIASIIMFQCVGGAKSFQSDRLTIHKNLCVCLLIAELVFMFGIDMTSKRIVCGIIAALLHYFFLAAFAWMFLEGFQLYAMLVEVFEPERARARWYYVFGYMIPLVIVGISGAIDANSYGTSEHCWLRTDNYFHLSFIGPATLVILANWFILALVIYMMCRHSNVSIKAKENNNLYKIRVWLRSSMVLAILLGLTWTFGLLYINQETVVMAFIFTILNSLQGLFIFISHCLQNEMFQKECNRLGRRHSWLSCCLRLAPTLPPGPTPATASSSAPGSQQCPQQAVPITTQSGKHPRYHRDHVEDQCLEDVSDREHPTGVNSSVTASTTNNLVINNLNVVVNNNNHNNNHVINNAAVASLAAAAAAHSYHQHRNRRNSSQYNNSNNGSSNDSNNRDQNNQSSNQYFGSNLNTPENNHTNAQNVGGQNVAAPMSHLRNPLNVGHPSAPRVPSGYRHNLQQAVHAEAATWVSKALEQCNTGASLGSTTYVRR